VRLPKRGSKKNKIEYIWNTFFGNIDRKYISRSPNESAGMRVILVSLIKVEEKERNT
jgi:hypothetical protein